MVRLQKGGREPAPRRKQVSDMAKNFLCIIRISCEGGNIKYN